MSINKKIIYVAAIVAITIFQGCDIIEKYELPEAGSIADATPPEAKFTYAQGEGSPDAWKTYSFNNQSISATSYAWNFGDGNTSTDLEPNNIYSGEGTYTVSLTAKDDLGVENTITEEITVVEPEAPAVADPILINADFDKQAKSSGSDCSCAGWINKSIGDQGESSSGNGGSDNVVKFDNNEPDLAYQEFAVAPNADYTITIVTSFKSPSGGTYPSQFELRVLAGNGYISGYTPVYFTTAAEYPQDDFGYTSISQVEDTANNLYVTVQSNPDDTGYLTNTYSFNSGANTSVALLLRGIGGPSTGGGGGDFGYNSGDEEIRVDSVVIEAM
ncbi:PKD domain-containing protein [uncultured Polaribacter sp.]|uniref:PKD domain-containing protein n=1 Tax=uncultured Polaribacter sp. TaxID=174711 RepID=UPI002630312D|nr:PKD domain-containing protein [uncultured Polaribacter sp.]